MVEKSAKVDDGYFIFVYNIKFIHLERASVYV